MWPSKYAVFLLYNLAVKPSIVYALGSPVQASDERSHLQQALDTNAFTDLSSGLSTLDDLDGLTDLFWQLTSSDAVHAYDRSETKDYRVNSRQIAFGHQARTPLSDFRNEQVVQSDHPACLEISMSTIGGYPIYHTHIALGNPPQPFNAWINTRLNGLYVRSSACSIDDCSTGFSYDLSKSSTGKSLEQRFEVYPKDWTVGGNVSTDTLHLVSLKIENATIGEIDKYEGDKLFYYVMEFMADGALGLAPPKTETAAYSPLSRPNPLYDLVKSHTVMHNVLTLTLPSSTEERGSLKVGQPSRPHKKTIRIPFGNETAPGLANTWHVPLNSVSLAGKGKFHVPLKSVYARLDLEPTIMLPPKATEELYEATGADPNSLFRGASIDCKAREKLPDLVFNVGGYDIRMTRDEYGAEYFAYGRSMCVVAILPSEAEDVAVLGTHLLVKYHVIIDIDGKELGLAIRHNN